MKTKSRAAAAASHAVQRAHARQLCHVISSSSSRLRIQRRGQVVEQRRGSRLVRAAQQAHGEREPPSASHAAQHTHRRSGGGGCVCRRERGAQRIRVRP
jgi:hypothetical protein